MGLSSNGLQQLWPDGNTAHEMKIPAAILLA
jgi:hypothetical protein